MCVRDGQRGRENLFFDFLDKIVAMIEFIEYS